MKDSILPQWFPGYDDPELDDVHAQCYYMARPKARRCPARRTFQVTIGDYEHSLVSRIGLTVAQVIHEEKADWIGEMKYMTDANGKVHLQGDRAIWEDDRLVAVIRCRPDGKPTVTTFAKEGCGQ